MAPRDALPVSFKKLEAPSIEKEEFRNAFSPYGQYIDLMLTQIENTARALNNLSMQVATAEPSVPLKGMMRYALDPWNPLGTGDGPVIYDGSAWIALTPTTIDVFTDVADGLVPASGGGTTNFLRADGSWAVPVDTSVFATLLDTKTPSGGANCDFSSISSSYNDLLFELEGVSHNNGAGQNFRVAFSDDNGSTFKNVTGMARGASTVSTSGATPFSLLSGTITAATALYGYVWVRGYKQTSQTLVEGRWASLTAAFNETSLGVIDKTTAINMIRFNFAAGNFDAGTVKMYGIKRA